MSPVARPARRFPVWSYDQAEGLVEQAFQRWKAGEPPRLVRKWLRKRGLHPWSLLFYDPSKSVQDCLQLDFRIPSWVREGLQWTPWHEDIGLILVKPGHLRRLPEGLVAPYLELRGARLTRLPRRLWTEALVLRNLPHLAILEADRSGLLHLEVEQCPTLKRLTLPAAGSLRQLHLRDCPQLEALPSLPTRRNPLPRMRLLRMPRLRDLGTRVQVETLFAWHCGSLRDLAGLAVKACLQLHDCPNLRSLPPVSGLVRLEVTACPSLLPLALPIGESVPGRFEPDWIPPGPATAPALREPEAQASPLFPEEPLGFAWPYPPPEPEEPSARHLLQTLESLGLPPFEKLRALATLLGHPAPAARLLLRQTDFPPEGVGLAWTWLRSLGPTDLTFLRAILSQVEALGLGAQSLAAYFSDQQIEDFGLPPSPCPGETNREARLAGPWVALPDIETVWHHDLRLRSIEGPLWVPGNLSIEECPFLEFLPDRMAVQGDLVIAHCPSLTTLPRRLDVHGDLILRNLPRLGVRLTHARISGRLRIEGVAPGGLMGFRIIPPMEGHPY